ncbi:MAG TPA: hypothetical protein H9836_10120, partial [Candidatus Nocardiopsis merdipullorum]|nr:hypothetical protein [Candidatus Nocardiopsis merdipullorum]
MTIPVTDLSVQVHARALPTEAEATHWLHVLLPGLRENRANTVEGQASTKGVAPGLGATPAALTIPFLSQAHGQAIC